MGAEDDDDAAMRGRAPPAAARAAARQARRLTAVFVAVWLAAFGVLYLLIDADQRERRRAQQPLTRGADELLIPRARDGHFYVAGRVAGQPVRFMVDTGASLVAVGEPLAARAGLADGEPALFHTANGTRRGRIVGGVTVEVGPFAVGGLRVGVGLDGRHDDDALLGQNVLARFDVELRADSMLLRLRR
jgi:aspartyl protease family protein